MTRKELKAMADANTRIIKELIEKDKELSEKDKRIKELEDGIDHVLQMAQGLNADELYDLIEELK